MLVHIWDTAGAEKYRSIAQAFYRNVQGCVLCYDVTSQDSFENMSFWAESIRQNCVVEVQSIMVGCKIDLDDQREVSREVAEQKARECGMQYIETSAKDMINVEEMFQILIDKVDE